MERVWVAQGSTATGQPARGDLAALELMLGCLCVRVRLLNKDQEDALGIMYNSRRSRVRVAVVHAKRESRSSRSSAVGGRLVR